MLMALEDLAAATYSNVEWHGSTRTVIFTYGDFPFYDGNDLSNEYRDWLLNFTFNNFAIPPSTAVVSASEPIPTGTEVLRALEAEIVRLVNTERAAEGLQPLSTDPVLDKAVRVRADELLILNSHTRPNGGRAATAFYEFPYTFNGENIAISMLGRSGEDAATIIVDMWLRSSGHRENIMRENSRFIGVGAVHGPDNKVYCVQVFMR
jgi:uncharacterized protein YkwD